MLNRWLRGAAGTAVAAAFVLSSTPALAHSAPQRPAHTLQAGAAAPAPVAKRLFNAWLRGDRAAAARVATPAAVRDLFATPWRAPDEFRGCAKNVCRFAYTSVRVPGGLGGILMVVSGNKVTRIHRPRLATKPVTAAEHLLAAHRAGNRYRALELATPAAVNTLFRVRHDPRAPKYLFQGCDKEPGGFSCAYYYEGGAMFLHVNGSAARGHQVYKISYIAD